MSSFFFPFVTFFVEFLNLGEGLGKEKHGISKPIKCGLKFDKAGIGYNEKVSQQETNRWWEQMYNTTAAKIFKENKKCDIENESKEERTNFISLTDEELFAACGGRTAHKAARHGHKLSGKLKRIEQQEQAGSSQTKSANLEQKCKKEFDENLCNESGCYERGKTKLKKRRRNHSEVTTVSMNFEDDSSQNDISGIKKRKKNRRLR